MLRAIKWLASGKAVGLDALPDRQLKKVLSMDEGIREKLRLFFEEILNGDRSIPEYFKTARTMFLSKDGTPYPKKGQVRIISMLSAITKLWEELLHGLLKAEVADKMPLHPN